MVRTQDQKWVRLSEGVGGISLEERRKMKKKKQKMMMMTITIPSPRALSFRRRRYIKSL